MAKKPRENLVWNAQVRQMMLAGEGEISAFAHIASRDPSNAHRALDKLIGTSAHSEDTEIATWAVSALAIGWNRYIAAKGDLSLGQAFNLEPKNDGGHDALPRDRVNRKTLDLAFEVEALVDLGFSKTRAIKVVAETNHRTASQLTKALRRPTDADLVGALKRLNARK